ncbi:hypothetical protein ACF1BQ_030445 [Bradyrhizobium sp. RDT10]
MAISKAPQALTRTEYLRRLAAVKSEMARRDVEALVLTSWAYLTGNVTRMYSLHALVVLLREEEPTLVVRGMDAPGCIHQTFMHRSKVIGYPESLVGNPIRTASTRLSISSKKLVLRTAGLGSSWVPCRRRT